MPDNYSIQKIASILNGKLILNSPDHVVVENLLADSRKIAHAETSLFFALKGDRRDGHQFIGNCLAKDVHNFIIDETSEWKNGESPILPKKQGNFVVVKDTLQALQELAKYHREQFS